MYSTFSLNVPWYPRDKKHPPCKNAAHGNDGTIKVRTVLRPELVLTDETLDAWLAWQLQLVSLSVRTWKGWWMCCIRTPWIYGVHLLYECCSFHLLTPAGDPRSQGDSTELQTDKDKDKVNIFHMYVYVHTYSTVCTYNKNRLDQLLDISIRKLSKSL